MLGDSFIPASQRPDGTWRKARRVKEGYVPQEEVPLYESKGKQFVNRQSKPVEPVRLASGHTAHTSIPGLFILDDSKEKKQTAKKKNKQKTIEQVTKELKKIEITESKPQQKKKTTTKTASVAVADTATTDPAKRLKNLKKKVREIESLEEKLKSGEIAKPEPEQLAKIKRKNDLLMEINQLEKKI